MSNYSQFTGANTGSYFSAFAGAPMNGVHIMQNPMPHIAGLAMQELGGIEGLKEKAADSPFLYGGLALIASPYVLNTVKKKKFKKKSVRKILLVGAVSIAIHFLQPFLMDKLGIQTEKAAA